VPPPSGDPDTTTTAASRATTSSAAAGTSTSAAGLGRRAGWGRSGCCQFTGSPRGCGRWCCAGERAAGALSPRGSG
jgi:hypothetical protein